MHLSIDAPCIMRRRRRNRNHHHHHHDVNLFLFRLVALVPAFLGFVLLLLLLLLGCRCTRVDGVAVHQSSRRASSLSSKISIVELPRRRRRLPIRQQAAASSSAAALDDADDDDDDDDDGATKKKGAGQQEVASAATKNGTTRRHRRVNENVRNIMDLLVARYGNNSGSVDTDNSGGDWHKMRRFLYRATTSPSQKQQQQQQKGGLTMNQVCKVLDFLDDEELFSTTANNNNDLVDSSLVCLQRSILQSSPRILSRNVRTQLRPTVDFLRSLYGPALFREAVSRNPDLLLTAGTGYTDKHCGLDLVECYLTNELQMSDAALRKLQRSAPWLFQTSMVQLLSVVSFLQEILEREKDDEQTDNNKNNNNNNNKPIKAGKNNSIDTTTIIRRMIESYPNIFRLSVPENLRPRIEYLRERCQLQDTDLASLFQRNSAAAILGLSVSANLRPTIDLLAGLLGRQQQQQPKNDDDDHPKNSNNQLRKTVLSHPQILCLSLGNLRSKIAYFDSIDNSNGNDCSATKTTTASSRLASRVLIRAPAVYSLSLHDNILPTVDYLARIWGATTHDGNYFSDSASLAALLGEYPSILTLSLKKNIQPTVAFYRRAGYLALDGDNRLVPSPADGKRRLIRGRYIAASLFNRLLPRWHYYHQHHSSNSNNNSNDDDPKSGEPQASPSQLPLHLLAGTADETFCQQLGLEYGAFVEFKAEAIPRLKFSSQFDTWLSTGVPIDGV